MAAISSIWLEEGRSTPISDLATDPLSRQTIELLAADGFCSFQSHEAGIVQMAASAVRNCILHYNISSSEIDGVILSTESFWDAPDAEIHNRAAHPPHVKLRQGLFAAAICETGLSHAHPYGTWMTACSNLATNLALANSLVSSGQHRNVMVVMSDKCSDRMSRIFSSGSTVLSDAAGAFVVGREAYGQWRIEHVVLYPLLHVRSLDGSFASRLIALKMLTQFAAKISAKTGRNLDQYDALISSNFHSMFLDIVGDGLNIDSSKLLQPMKAQYGHAFSMECLGGLREADGLAIHGRRVGVFIFSDVTYAFVDLSRT